MFKPIIFNAVLGLLIFLSLLLVSQVAAISFVMGYSLVLLVDLIFYLRTLASTVYSPKKYLRVFMRAQMQKIILYGLLIAGVLRYIRPNLFAFVIALVVAIIMGRVFNLIEANRKAK